MRAGKLGQTNPQESPNSSSTSPVHPTTNIHNYIPDPPQTGGGKKKRPGPQPGAGLSIPFMKQHTCSHVSWSSVSFKGLLCTPDSRTAYTYPSCPRQPHGQNRNIGYNSSTTNMAAKYSSGGLITFSILVLPTFTPTNSVVPTGGVMVPIHRLNIIIIPKCTVFIPGAWQIGGKIGVKIRQGRRHVHKCTDNQQEGY